MYFSYHALRICFVRLCSTPLFSVFVLHVYAPCVCAPLSCIMIRVPSSAFLVSCSVLNVSLRFFARRFVFCDVFHCAFAHCCAFCIAFLCCVVFLHFIAFHFHCDFRKRGAYAISKSLDYIPAHVQISHSLHT